MRHARIYPLFAIAACCALFLNVANAPVFCQDAQTHRETTVLLNKVGQNLASLYSIRSNIRMNVSLNGEEYFAQGEYIEKIYAPEPNELTKSKYRLHLTFPLSANASNTDSLNELIVVCDLDRNRVWNYTSIEGVKRQDFVDISQVLAAIKKSRRPPQTGILSGLPTLGGVGGMMIALQRNYVFPEAPEETSLKGKTPLPVWKIRGTLTPQSLARLKCKPDQKQPYPAHLPIEVEIFIGKEDLFPYRLHYYHLERLDAPKRTLLTQVIYCDVLFNDRDIPDYRFSTADMFNERAADTRNDMTRQYIRSLGL